ncbi:MAG: DUF4491 family protein [Anaerolineales bacterium]
MKFGINDIGFITGVSLFLGIWLGHVGVRKLEFNVANIKLPSMLFFLIGCILEWISITGNILEWKVIFGVVGVTLIWDALELFRQEKRVQRGHAPANPANPRHQRILQQYSDATLMDPFKPDLINSLPISFNEKFDERKEG